MGTASEPKPGAGQQITEAVNDTAVSALLKGDWLTPEIVKGLRAEAEEHIMGRVMSGLSPDLRGLMSDRRADLRNVVLLKLELAIVSEYTSTQ